MCFSPLPVFMAGGFFFSFFLPPSTASRLPVSPPKRRGAFILGEEEKNNNSSIVDTSKPYMRAAMRSLTMASIVPSPHPQICSWFKKAFHFRSVHKNTMSRPPLEKKNILVYTFSLTAPLIYISVLASATKIALRDRGLPSFHHKTAWLV